MENEELNPTAEVQKMENELEQEVEKVFCIKCGAELAADQLFCPKCGHKVGDAVDSETPESPAKKNKMALIIGIIAAVVVLAVGGIVAFFIIRGKQANSITLNVKELTITEGESGYLKYTIDPNDTKDKTVNWTSSNESIATVNDGTIVAVNEGTCEITVTTVNGKTDTCKVIVEAHIPNFKEMYAYYDSNDWCDIASDGSYMKVDTNPNDFDSDNLWLYYETFSEADKFIESVNSALGFSSALKAKMNTTTWSMGRQTQENDRYIVSWTYHPDKGLEVMYEVKGK